ncbi:MAG: acyloxyacyl hydrolase [Microscillaceae bacterium]|jgi:hypothetical protein|nr:acyloxyacyl hydrolase [Microscillaceae bacterium]
MKRKIFSLYLWIGLSLGAMGQDSIPSKSLINLGIRGHYGFIISHSPELKSNAQSQPWGLELDWSRHLNNEKSWQIFGCYPRVGLTASFINFVNPRVLGNAYSISTYFEPYLAVQKRLNASFRLGGGISYLNQVYNAETNPENLFFSSPISFILTAGVGLNYRVNSHWTLRLTGFYNHISNGGMQNPNKGINFPTLSLGTEYTFNPQAFENRNSKSWREVHTQRTHYQVFVFGTAKPLDKEEAQRFAIFGLNAQVSQIVSRMSALSLGVDWEINRQRQALWRAEDLARRHPNQVGVLVGHELLLGKLSFTQQVGLYVWRAYPSGDALYQRYGLAYRIRKHYLIGISLKAHRHVADFLDFRLGYRW